MWVLVGERVVVEVSRLLLLHLLPLVLVLANAEDAARGQVVVVLLVVRLLAARTSAAGHGRRGAGRGEEERGG